MSDKVKIKVNLVVHHHMARVPLRMVHVHHHALLVHLCVLRISLVLPARLVPLVAHRALHVPRAHLCVHHHALLVPLVVHHLMARVPRLTAKSLSQMEMV